MTVPRTSVIHFADAQATIPGPPGPHAASFLQRGRLHVKLSVPGTHVDNQSPHAQDEIYVIVRGRGIFFHDGRRDPFEAGDLLFIAAGAEHRFEDYSSDLAVWVVFYGPDGGEVPA